MTTIEVEEKEAYELQAKLAIVSEIEANTLYATWCIREARTNDLSSNMSNIWVVACGRFVAWIPCVATRKLVSWLSPKSLACLEEPFRCKLVEGLLSKFYAFGYIRVIVCTQLEKFLHHFAARTYRVGIYQYSRLASRTTFVSQLAHRPLEASSN